MHPIRKAIKSRIAVRRNLIKRRMVPVDWALWQSFKAGKEAACTRFRQVGYSGDEFSSVYCYKMLLTTVGLYCSLAMAVMVQILLPMDSNLNRCPAFR